MNVSELRREYTSAHLDSSDVEADPMKQFERWLSAAIQAQVVEPTAMSLATVGLSGKPSCRIVLLKGHDARGLVFYTNYQSRKGRELEAYPHAACTFHWAQLERQVRIEGRIEHTSAAESDAYFASRPVGSRIGAAVSAQSTVVASRDELERAYAEALARLGEHVPRPDHWGGYRLVPDAYEFWQGRPSRLHDRIAYHPLAGGGWRMVRLAP